MGEGGAAAGAGGQLDDAGHPAEGAFLVLAEDAHAAGLDPLEGVFLPDGGDATLLGQAVAADAAGLLVEPGREADGGQADGAVESLGVGDEGPELAGGSGEVPGEVEGEDAGGVDVGEDGVGGDPGWLTASDALDLVEEGDGVGVAGVGLLGESLLDEGGGGVTDRRFEGAGGGGRLVAVAGDHLDEALALEGGSAGEHVEEGGAQGIHVGAGVDPVASALLGRHVMRRTDDGVVGGQRERLGLDDVPGQAEVGESDAGRDGGDRLGESRAGAERGGVVLFEENVLGLDVAVDDAEGVGVGQGAGNVGEDRQRGRLVELAALDEQGAEAPAADVFDDEEMNTGVVVDFEEVGDVGAVDFGEQPGFLAEAAERIGPGRQLGSEDLDGDDLAVSAVLGAEDGPHTPLPQLLAENVATKLITGRQLGDLEAARASGAALLDGHGRGSRQGVLVDGRFALDLGGAGEIGIAPGLGAGEEAGELDELSRRLAGGEAVGGFGQEQGADEVVEHPEGVGARGGAGIEMGKVDRFLEGTDGQRRARRLAGDQPVEQDTEGEGVGCLGGGMPLETLRGLAGVGQGVASRVGADERSREVADVQAGEIEQEIARLSDTDRARNEPAVVNPESVGLGQSVGQGLTDPDRLGDSQRQAAGQGVR